ncbi:CHAT domain-containing protein [Scytonema sp. NUACC26]|uniref:CHAT domain-containing protein n=1 Tax=Scytonema sp. NUACC26 TaxID=3140176 RepID=UPI0034DCA3B3
MQKRKVGFAFLITLLASTAAPLIVSLPAVSVSMRVAAQTTDNRKQEADKLLKQGNQQFKTSQYKAALNSYEQALKIYQSIGDQLGEGNSLGNLGNTYSSLGEYKQAIKYYQQHLEIAHAIGDRYGEGNSLGNLGLAYDSLGEYKQAIKYHQQSLEIKRAIGNRLGEGATLGNLGVAYSSLGEYKQAIKYHQQSLEIARAIGNRYGEGAALGNLGNAYDSLGEYKQAIQYHQQHLEIARAIDDRNGEGASLSGLGNAYNSLGEYKQAIQYHQQHLEIARAIGNRNGEGATLGNLGLAYRSLGEYKQAIQYHQQSLEIARAIGNRNGEGATLGNLGLAYSSLGEYKQAIKYHQQHLEIARAIGDRYGEGNSLNNLGLSYLNFGQSKPAEQYLRDAITVLESQRERLGNNHTFKVSLFDTQAHTYRLLQQALIAQKQSDNALVIAERGRARAFAELIIEQQQLSSSPPPNLSQIRLVAKQQKATIVYYSIAWNHLYIWVVKLNGEVVFHNADLKNKNLGTFAEDTRSAAVNLAEGNSPPQSVADELITGWVRQTRSAVAKTDDSSSAPSSDGVRRPSCRGNLCLQQMYSLLIQPIAKQLPTHPDSRVIFVPHESLFLVPFAALQDQKDQKFLIEKHTIAIAPSIHVLQLTHQKKLALKSRPSTKTDSMMVVGNPKMPKVPSINGATPAPLESLPGAQQEATTIAQMFQTAPLTGDRATKAVVTKHMTQANYIHFATHGLLENLGEPGIPGAVALAPDAQDDGLLSADEVLKMKLKAELVVLSACDTGRGRITGDGVIGLPRAFISAGTPSIVVSLWRVSDESTAFFMPEFYRQLKVHKDKAIALRQAMLTTMKKYPHPSDWSAFLLIGEAE